MRIRRLSGALAALAAAGVLLCTVPALGAEVISGIGEDNLVPADDLFPANQDLNDFAEDTSYDSLVVASTTPLTGRFFSDQWGNGAADLDVRSMIHGYNLIRWNAEEGMFEIDTSVVSGSAASTNEQGDESFHISLYQDLQFSDGTKVTAENYVFSLLLGLSPQMRELGAQTGDLSYIQGATDYMEGRTQVLSGVRLTSEYEFTITIDHANLPFFYELGLLDLVPYPIDVITPGYRVEDRGEGVCFVDSQSGEITEPDTQLLERTLLDEQSGYMSHPSVTSGPYLLTAYDGAQAQFRLNPLYKGNSEGIRPSITDITFLTVSNDEIVTKLESGALRLVNRVSDKEAIQAGIEAVNSDGGTIAMSSYPRSGLSFISFCADHHAALSSENVRQAFAWCLDRDGLTGAYEDRYGTSVAGWFGIGQWMYSLEREFVGTLPSYTSEDAAEDIAEAVRLLEADGWTLNAEGAEFDAAADTVRCKRMEDGSLLSLNFTLACQANGRIAGLLQTFLAQRLAQAGILLQIEPVEGVQLLNMYSGARENTYDLLYLATNFSVVFDPCDLFTVNEEGMYQWSSTGIADNDLYELALQMRHCESGDVENYRERWRAFQERFCETLPALPVYSNVYFDFYTSLLQNYNPAMTTSWAQAVAQAYLSDAPAQEAATEEES